MHGCVVCTRSIGVVVPLIKDSLGDVNSSANYRGITLSVILSKMFEYCIIHKYEVFLQSSDQQFGF